MAAQSDQRSRRTLLVGIGTTAAAYGLGLATPALIDLLRPDPIREAIDAVIPAQGHRTVVVFEDSILRMVDAGAIDPQKFAALYEARGGLPDWVDRLFREPSSEPIVISSTTAPYLLNLLWPLGLATKARFNADSPLRGERLATFASTGGWRLGRTGNGAAYFNMVESLDLTDEAEARVLALARNTFRPCCNNSAFFQDCNHGSAMLGLLELAASQGLPEPELFRLAKTINGYWYPTQYVEMAIVFAAVHDKPWKDVDPAMAVGAKFSSASGWTTNVHRPLVQAGLLREAPRQQKVRCAA